MKTYQDLLAVGQNEKDRMDFVIKAVQDHKLSPLYKIASDAEAYYAKRNVTIEKFQKVLYNMMGQAVPDYFSANYKLKTGFFRRFVLQQVMYVLSNGVTFENEDTVKKLGADFENKLSTLAKKAMVGSRAFGFWNFDHLEVFSFVDTPNEPGFVPLYDEDTSLLCAGVRYSSNGISDRYTLYELDGYTEYIKRKDEDITVLNEKRKYIQTIKQTEAGGVEAVEGSNYPGFPIIPMYANDLKQSEIVGIRESIDCYDFIKSGMANQIDDTSSIYWVLKGTGGMDDVDLQRFLERMKVVKAANIEPDMDVEAHTLDVPVAARESILNRLRNDLYEDFMLLDTEKALSGNITATGIRLAYQAQDDKCGDFECYIRDFISKLFNLLGVEDTPNFKWNRIANMTEETNMVLAASQYLDDEAVLKHLPWIMTEEVDEIMQRKADLEINRYIPPDGVEE